MATDKGYSLQLNKAYEILTNEESKTNFELYGNPDGPTSMRLSVGLPQYVLDKKNHFKNFA